MQMLYKICTSVYYAELHLKRSNGARSVGSRVRVQPSGPAAGEVLLLN